MNNAILFFYNLNISESKKINDNYYFNYQENNYVVHLYTRNINEALEIYYLNIELSSKIPTYEIILTTKQEILFNHNDKYYVLMKIPNIKNRLITYQDIKSFKVTPNIKIKGIDKSNWSYNWSKKIDFIEYQFNQVTNKYKIISSSIDYYLGMWENAISYFNNNRVQAEKVISHKRITTSMDLLEFLNPLNIVVDYKERDEGDYIKSYVLNENYSENQIMKFLQNINTREDAILLITRVLFPSYYFDIYDDIVINNRNETDIKEIISKQKNINTLLYYMFNYFSKFNINKIDWIKKDIV